MGKRSSNRSLPSYTRHGGCPGLWKGLSNTAGTLHAVMSRRLDTATQLLRQLIFMCAFLGSKGLSCCS